ncbi:MAG: putative RNA binding protein with dsRBD fold (UPF0201 family) [Paraglaciecola sp.]
MSNSGTVKSADKTNTPADAQIHAHQQHHQKQIKKLLLLVLSGIAVLLVVSGVYWVMSTQSSADALGKVSKTSTLTEQQQAQFREQFKQALTEFEIELQPQLDKIALANWQVPRLAELANLKQNMLNKFAQGEFVEAKEAGENLLGQTRQLITEWQNQNQSYLDTARALFSEGNILQAQLSLNKALVLVPEHPQALSLQKRIQIFTLIDALQADLQVAKVERDLLKQIDILSKIASLDPTLSNYTEDLHAVQSAYQRQQLIQALADAEHALNSDKLATAQGYIEKALRLSPNSKGAELLAKKIAQAKTTQSLTGISRSLEKLVQADEWQLVLKSSAHALGKHPNDSTFKDYNTKANKVLAAQQSLNIFIAQPARLAEEHIRDAAKKRLQQAVAASLWSNNLQQQIAQVAKTIDQYSKPVDVTVKSDGLTFLTVVGVGQVGAVVEKVIQLTQGKYVLQGRRLGYRNKRMEFVVAAQQTQILELICDEAI